MHLKKGLNVAIVRSMITFVTFSASPINHASAEENIITESTARLSALEISEFKLDQTFSKDVTNYTASVSNDISSMSLHLDTEIEGTLLTVNGEEVTGKDQLLYSLNTTATKDQPTITNLVSPAQTGSGSTRTSSTVQGTSTSSTGTQAETPTTANLSALTVSSGTWNKSFNSQ